MRSKALHVGIALYADQRDSSKRLEGYVSDLLAYLPALVRVCVRHGRALTLHVYTDGRVSESTWPAVCAALEAPRSDLRAAETDPRLHVYVLRAVGHSLAIARLGVFNSLFKPEPDVDAEANTKADVDADAAAEAEADADAALVLDCDMRADGKWLDAVGVWLGANGAFDVLRFMKEEYADDARAWPLVACCFGAYRSTARLLAAAFAAHAPPLAQLQLPRPQSLGLDYASASGEHVGARARKETFKDAPLAFAYGVDQDFVKQHLYSLLGDSRTLVVGGSHRACVRARSRKRCRSGSSITSTEHRSVGPLGPHDTPFCTTWIPWSILL